MSRILVVAAHPDDEILGLGGTIRKYINEGHIVDCLILGEGATSRNENKTKENTDMLQNLKKNALRASKIIGFNSTTFYNFSDNRFDSIDLLDIIKVVEKEINTIKPDIIFTHHFGDLNIDHRRTFEAVITATRPVGDYYVKEIYCFETPSSTEWNFNYGDNSFKPNVFVNIEDTLEQKLLALKCYETEMQDYPHPRSIKSLEIIASRWGTVVGKKYVEAFLLFRKVD